VIFSFWWTCFWWRHHFRSAMSSGALLTSGAVLLQMLLSFLFVKFFALFCSSRPYKWSQKFCLWSCTIEQILAYPINNFLIPCYHSKLLRVMLNTFCSNNICIEENACANRLANVDFFVDSLVWWDQLLSFSIECFFRDKIGLHSYNFQ